MGVGAPRRRCDERRPPRGGACGAAWCGARIDDDSVWLLGRAGIGVVLIGLIWAVTGAGCETSKRDGGRLRARIPQDHPINQPLVLVPADRSVVSHMAPVISQYVDLNGDGYNEHVFVAASPRQSAIPTRWPLIVAFGGERGVVEVKHLSIVPPEPMLTDVSPQACVVEASPLLRRPNQGRMPYRVTTTNGMSFLLVLHVSELHAEAIDSRFIETPVYAAGDLDDDGNDDVVALGQPWRLNFPFPRAQVSSDTSTPYLKSVVLPFPNWRYTHNSTQCWPAGDVDGDTRAELGCFTTAHEASPLTVFDLEFRRVNTQYPTMSRKMDSVVECESSPTASWTPNLIGDHTNQLFVSCARGWGLNRNYIFHVSFANSSGLSVRRHELFTTYDSMSPEEPRRMNNCDDHQYSSQETTVLFGSTGFHESKELILIRRRNHCEVAVESFMFVDGSFRRTLAFQRFSLPQLSTATVSPGGCASSDALFIITRENFLRSSAIPRTVCLDAAFIANRHSPPPHDGGR